MIELMANINAFVNTQTGDVGRNINEDFFGGDSPDEIMCRHDSSSLIDRRYLTGDYWAAFNFSYYAKSLNPISARQTIEAISAALEIDNFCDLLGLQNGRLEIIARPTPVSRDETGTVIYTSSYKLVYYQEVS